MSHKWFNRTALDSASNAAIWPHTGWTWSRRTRYDPFRRNFAPERQVGVLVAKCHRVFLSKVLIRNDETKPE